jgi:hypothetical protein
MLRLPYHNRYSYSAITERKDYSWPDGKRLAVYLGLNIEHFAFGAGDGHLLTVAGTPPDQHHGVRLRAADRGRPQGARR